MTPAERAERLKLAVDDEADRVRAEERAVAAARKHGLWHWRPVGGELQFRSRSLPTLRLDILRSEARDLAVAISKALGEKALALPRTPATQRQRDTKARRAWNKAHETERAAALKQLAEDFAAGGGW